MDSRKEELEKKRKRLAELRKQTEDRKQAFQQNLTKPPAAGTSSPGSSSSSRKEVDDLISTLVGEPAPPQPDSRGEEAEEPVSEPKRHEGSPTPVETRDAEVQTFTSAITASFDYPPKRVETYDKEIQTDEIEEPEEEESTEKITASPQRTKVSEIQEEEKAALEKVVEQKSLDMPEEQKKVIFQMESFADFVNNSAKMLERALNEPDFLIDYSKEVESSKDSGDIKLSCQFYDETYSKHRAVTDLDWSQKHPELLAASYNSNSVTHADPEGVVLVWSLFLQSRPEYIFHSPSPVLTTRFSPFHPQLVIGGTYSGQILIWDIRAKSHPVLKTPLSASGHTHPVYKMEIIGTQNAHNLVSISSDGLLCSWNLDQLTIPQETLELSKLASKADEVAISTFGFQDKENSSFIVGTEDGNAYQASRFERTGAKSGINKAEPYQGHAGPITGLHFHPSSGQYDFSDLFLTSSIDWSVKLWRTKDLHRSSQQPAPIQPLRSFDDFGDYVLDVAWSPVHPAVFSAVDAGGRYSLWNLNAETEVPVKSAVVGHKGLNKIRWNKDGTKNAIASSDGNVFIYDIGEHAVPKPNDYEKFQKTVSDFNPRHH